MAKQICVFLTAILLLGYAKASQNDDLQKALSFLENGDIQPGLKLFESLAKKGMPEAQGMLGAMYFEGFGVQQNDETALRWTTPAAENGFGPSQYAMGWVYWEGRGVRADAKTAVKWMTLAAEQGDAAAAADLGYWYMHSDRIARDYPMGLKWSLIAAKRGETKGQMSMAWAYTQGWGTEPNNEKALKWFTVAAEQGELLAQDRLGTIYKEGIGVEPNLKTALRWYMQAAEQKHGPALYEIGRIHEKNLEKTEKNLKQAVVWYRRAIAEKYSMARLALMSLLINNISEAKNDKEIANACADLKFNADYLDVGYTYPLMMVRCELWDVRQAWTAWEERSNAGDIGSSLFLAKILENGGRYSAALAYVKRAEDHHKKQGFPSAGSLEVETSRKLDPNYFVNDMGNSISLKEEFEPELDKESFASRKNRLKKITKQIALQELHEKARSFSASDVPTIKREPLFVQKEPHPVLNILGGIGEVAANALIEALAVTATVALTEAIMPGTYKSPTPVKTRPSNDGAFGTPGFQSRNRSSSFQTQANPSASYTAGTAGSCSCSCVNGKSVALCSSAIAVAPMCTNWCPQVLTKDPLANIKPIRVPPIGTTSCERAQVYNDKKSSYETKTICK